MSEAATNLPTILCPVQFEYNALIEAGLKDKAELVCCGPGAEGIVRWAEHNGPDRRIVILAGLAGGLRESAMPGSAYLVSTVMALNGRQYRATMEYEHQGNVKHKPLRAVIASSENVLTSKSEKIAIAEKSGADLVDLESGIFAEAAGTFGWRWAIVRGVSDGHDFKLPPDIGHWVDRSGKTRTISVCVSLLRRPWIIPSILKLSKHSTAAMKEVGVILNSIIDTV